jgi:hypothetical protein
MTKCVNCGHLNMADELGIATCEICNRKTLDKVIAINRTLFRGTHELGEGEYHFYTLSANRLSWDIDGIPFNGFSHFDGLEYAE